MLRIRTSYTDALGHKEVITSKPIKIAQTLLDFDFAIREKKLIYLYTNSPQAKTTLNPSRFSVQADQGLISIRSIKQNAKQGLIKIKLSERLGSKEDLLLSYKDSEGDQITGVIQSRAGSDMQSFNEIIYSSSRLLEGPAPSRAELRKSNLIITFDEIINPSQINESDFEVNIGNRTLTPSSAKVNRANPNSIRLKLNPQRIPDNPYKSLNSVSYFVAPRDSRSNIVQDIWGNDTESFYNFPVELT